jgi:centrin-1
MNKYKKYYDDIGDINPDPDDEGMGIDQLEEPFISLGLAYSRDEVGDLIASVDDDGSGKIEFDEFLRIIHNKSKKKSKGNEKITSFFKNLANNNISKESDLHHFSFKTIMGILRRNNLLKAFMGSDKEKSEGERILKAYSSLLEKKK